MGGRGTYSQNHCLTSITTQCLFTQGLLLCGSIIGMENFRIINW